MNIYDSYLEQQSTDDHLLLPPYSAEAESAVLGGLLLNPKKYTEVSEIISKDDFYQGINRFIYSAIESLAEANQPIDIITLAEQIDSDGNLDNVGGLPHLADLQNNTPSAANVHSYARAVKNKSTERALITVSREIGGLAYDETPTDEKVLKSQALIMGIESCDGEEVAQANAGIKNVIEEIDRRFHNDSGINGLATGLSKVDYRTNGLRGSDLIIVAGRPGMGKTTFAMGIVKHCVIDEQKPALVFSMEMSQESLLERMTSNLSGIPFNFIRSGKLQEQHWPMLTSGISRLKDSPLYIDDRAALSVNQMRSTARKLHKKVGLGCIVVDYIQLAKSKNPSREQQISEISGGLKAIAKELNIPVIALSQLNRKCEEGPNKRPGVHHLRDSGSIEQDADVIWLLYRDEFYNEDSQHKGIAEVITGKMRNGETGTDYIRSRLDVNRFENLDCEVPEIIEEKPKRFKVDH